MNKKFTMVCASLLLASAFSVNADALNNPTKAPFPVNTEVKDGFKFYLTKTEGAYSVSEKETTDKKKVFVLGEANQEIGTENSKAAVFEVRGIKKVGDKAQFELYVDGNKLYYSNAGKLADLVSSFYVSIGDDKKFTSDDLKKISTVVFAAQGDVLVEGAEAATASLVYTAEELNEFNSASTTFSFDFADNELVGNLFNQVVPVTVDGNTYFIKGSADDVKAYVADQKADNAKKVSFLAVNKNQTYNLNAKNDKEGYALYWMEGKNIYKDGVSTADSLKNAQFTEIKEADILNAKEVMSLKMENALGGVDDLQIAAVKTSPTDTKAYVTTVVPTASSWSTVKNPMLGANTYLPASEFLKTNEMSTFAVLVVNGVPGGNRYYNYVISTGSSDNKEVYKPASELDFSMAQNQWVVADFDGRYTLTLQNRLSSQILKLRLTKTENGYSVEPSTQGLAQVYNADGEYENAVIKLLPIKTTSTDGYLTLTDKQIKDGIRLSFSGETELAGKKEFFGVKSWYGNENDKTYIFNPSLESDDIVTFKPVKNLNDDKKDQISKEVKYACLNAEGKIVEKTNKLIVPTYVLATELNEDGEVVEALSYDDSNYEFIYTTSNPKSTVFAFAKNMAGNYSLVELSNDATVNDAAKKRVVNVATNNTGMYFDNYVYPGNEQYYAYERYDKDYVNKNFANVNVLASVVLNESLPAIPGHYTFDNERGSINVKNLKGINEGFLASEGQVFWLDTADIEKATPSFYISFGKDSVAARNYMFNPIDSAKIFDEYTASYKYNDVYYYGENANYGIEDLKVAYASTVAEEGKDLADAFKFNITLKEAAVADEYVISSVKDDAKYVGQKNGVVILTNKDNAMVFTVNPAEAPTSNESVVASEVKVVANNGSVVVKNAAGKNVVVSTILGQVVANEVLTSDNATINVPAGIVVVAVEGESFKVNVK